MSPEYPFLTWLGQAGVVALGWYVVHNLSSGRDRDKARREMVATSAEGLSNALTDLLTEARNYHLSARNVTSELKIKMTLQDISMRVIALSDIESDQKILTPCRSELSALRRAISARHFEDEHIAPLNEADPQYQEIAEATLRAKRALLTVKHKQFPR
ncbi:hypothetical protein ACO2Q9_10605 [Variovorax sp. VNK109]|uniref:hypothetical protein n=1 Tax=Variovorax sp. VNK109 TaxID=3400919 RepID=UPI003C0ED74B